jgi:hypothetical protein
MRIKDEPLPPGSIGALIARMRRRTKRVAAALALLAGVLAAVVVFAIVACKATR